MMRWNAELPASVDDIGAADRSTEPTFSGGQGQDFMQYALAAIADTVVRLGGRAIVGTMVLALIVVALFFGLSAEEAAATSRWCMKC